MGAPKRKFLTLKKIGLVGGVLFLILIPLAGIFHPTLIQDKTTNEIPAIPFKDPPSGNTLLLVHGYGLNARIHYEDTYTDPFIISYYNSVVPIDYYGNVPSSPEAYSLGQGFDLNTPIEVIATVLKDFILDPNNSALFSDTIDVVGFSMGGLIVRYMIDHFYDEFKAANFTFDDVLLIATPNYGSYHIIGAENLFMTLFGIEGVLVILVFLFSSEEKKMLRLISLIICFLTTLLVGAIMGGSLITTTALQVRAGSSFLQDLNQGDTTPYSVDDIPPNNDINYSTFRGLGGGKFFFERFLLFFSFSVEPNDGEVHVSSVPLGDGCMNYGPYDRNHDEMVTFNMTIPEDRAYFSDIYYALTGLTYPP